jgi:hypothetical protein
MILFNLDMKGIAVSEVVLARAEASSHVLSEMLSDEDLRRPSLYFLSHYNSKKI